jgi:hypothetical protein
MYKKKTVLFSDRRGRIQEIEIPENSNPRTLCAISEIREFVPKKHVLQNTLCAAVPSGISIGTFSDIFSEMSQILKCKKMQKRKKCKKKCPENTSKFWVFYRK